MKRKRIDLSVPQVAGSAVAAVVAAKLASYFGVYGTILGAGLVSVVATCGGSLFQHFFRRTGEQFRDGQFRDGRFRDLEVAAKPRVRTPPAPGEFTEGTVHRARIGRRKRPVVAAALVFGVAMAGITTYELVSGDSFSGDKGTTVTEAVSGGGSSSGTSYDSSDEDSATTSPSPSSSSSPSTGEPAPSGGSSSPASDNGEDAGDGTGGGTTAGTAPTPTATEGGTGADDSATPAPTESATTPEPSASSRSGTGDQDPADPAAP
ncbi:hypothetical protein [Streptomyces cacaoi]|uniref:hypothetical protein n=1 Tax=Streptomyces cacaoi TaxID=1898 RepID=UPI003747A1D8